MVDAAREAWRQLVAEPALDPELPIIDAHHHFVPEPHRPRLERYVVSDMIDDIENSGHLVIATVHVEAFSNYRDEGPESLRVVGETEYVERIANEAAAAGHAGLCAAIVGHGDLMLGSEVGEVLDAHLAASPRFRGVRQMTICDPDLPSGIPGRITPGMLLRPEFRLGLREVERRGLSFDAGVVQSQLGELLETARRFPATTFVLGHIGTPMGVGRYADDLANSFARWRAGMSDLATCENILVKIGGLNMPFTTLGATNNASRPFTSDELAARQRSHVLTSIDLFGPERCMFESNFPVDKWYTSYSVLWNSFKRMTGAFSAAERDALFHGTARRAYRMTWPHANGEDG